jgi:DNA-binding GntR family transcriptional regulator
MEEVDRDSPTAPYVQIADHLAGQIERGDLAPGSRLPSVTDIVQTWDVSRTTAGKALKLLVARDLAVMSVGMGTYVKR